MQFWRLRVFGDFSYYAAGVAVELGASRVLYRDVQGSEDQLGTFQVDGVAHQCIDDFHQRGLDGFFVLNDGDGVEARLRRPADTAVGVLVEVTKLLSAERGGAATDSGDFDMSAGFAGEHVIDPVANFLVLRT